MTNDIVPSNNEIQLKSDGFIVDKGGKPLFFSNEELRVVGCRNCVWKESGDCPELLEGDDVLPEGYCKSLASFIVKLADSGDIVSGVWEKYYIYKARLQEASDYKDYLRLKGELKSARLDKNISDDDLRKLEMQESSAKLWWARFNENITKNLAKVSDRYVKTRVDAKPSTGIGMAKVVNFNIIQDSEKDVKVIEDKKSD